MAYGVGGVYCGGVKTCRDCRLFCIFDVLDAVEVFSKCTLFT